MDGLGEWPELPLSAFIAGRLATEADVFEGRAVFYEDGSKAWPLDIVIPQYGVLSRDDGAALRVVIVQAQQNERGSSIVGLRDAKGQEYVADIREVRLVGRQVEPAARQS